MYSRARIGGVPRLPPGFRTRGGFQELKTVDMLFTAPTLNTVPAWGAATYGDDTAAFAGMSLLNEIELGDRDYQRDGTKILMKSVRISGNLTLPTSAGVTWAQVRMLVVYDKQTNGTAPLIGDILSSSKTGGGFDTFTTPPNARNRGRFEVLCDRYFFLSKNQAYAIPLEFYRRLNHPVQYNGQANTIADISSGGLFFLLFASFNTTESAVLWNGVTGRVTFLD